MKGALRWQVYVSVLTLENAKLYRLFEILNVNFLFVLFFYSIRHQSRQTNLGRILEKHGSELLGSSYKDPITSFSLFQKFSVQHPEVSIHWQKLH